MIYNPLRRIFKRQPLKPAINERESTRYNITMFARYRGTGTFVERRGNVGIGGFCFEGECEYEPGAGVDLLFRLPGTVNWIHAGGTVLGHTRANGWLGIRGCFSSISFENERRLARWLDNTSLQIQLAAA
ncbi:MAG TPA: hypothetical protein VM425_09835 [Myxococcota bacterium]|nr:hypothetical protein [Myxococcota bacterium]